MKWVKEREKMEKEALETLVGEMKELGWVKRPDTRELYVTHHIQFEKGEKRIIISWNEFVSFNNNITEWSTTVNGYVLIAITKYLHAVKF